MFAAFNRGLYEATKASTQLRWLVDDGGSPCPDAEDNSLAGLVTKGEAYPTGHCYPPAHPRPSPRRSGPNIRDHQSGSSSSRTTTCPAIPGSSSSASLGRG